MNSLHKLKFVSVMLLIVWFGLFISKKSWQNFMSAESRLESLWSEDFKILQKSKILPPGFNHLKDIEAHASSEKMKKFLQTHKHPDFGESPQGRYKLEIFLDETETGEIMIQYDLLDHKGNTVWELGRTLKIK